jgi:D-alanine-D-alanine ligase
LKIVVLAGGYSPEREVSLTSGSLIANALIENGHEVLLLDVYVGMRELPKCPDSLFSVKPYPVYRVGDVVPDLEKLRAECQNGEALIGANVLYLCSLADKTFLALHGSMGENGQLQATLDTHGIRYTGSGYLGSAVAMDKDLSKRLMRDAGVPTPDWVYFDVKSGKLDQVIKNIGFPAVEKPCDCGSSVGVSMMNNQEELANALQTVSEWGRYALIEKKIEGRELTVGVINGKALPSVEILPPEEGFYDYKNKYQGTTRELCPAPIPKETEERLGALALRTFDALRLGGYARFDFMMDENGGLWCLEANSLPGMTPTSLLPQEAAALGISYRELCEMIVML